jgi:hypothetical protein
MKIPIVTLIISGLLFGYFLPSNAADTLKINLTYQHKLNNSGQTTGSITIRQDFYTPDGVFFRQINYDENSGAPVDYIYRFFHNNKLFTEERYNFNDSLLYILKYEYDANGNETTVTKLIKAGKGLIEAEKTVLVYGPNHQKLSCRKYFGKQVGEQTKYKYDALGNLIYEKTTNKPIAKTIVKQEIREYSHTADGKIQQVSVQNKEFSGNKLGYTEEYLYNTNGLVSGIKKMNSDGTLLMQKIFRYLPSLSPSMYEEHDATGKITLLIEYDYRKHYMDKGTQVSYYESL